MHAIRPRLAACLRAGLLLAWLPLLCIAANSGLTYPATKREPVTETHFGITYADNYRWLEKHHDPEPAAWFKAQAELTDSLLSKIPASEVLAQEWQALDKLKPAKYGGITHKGGRTFYKKTLGGENVGKLYVRDGWTGQERLLLDPGTYKEGVVTTINSFLPSYDGRHVALGFTSGGAEFSEIRILDVDTGKFLPESYYPSYGPAGWTPDSKGLLYDASKVSDIKSLDIELNRQTRLHILGTPMEKDIDLFSNQCQPGLGISAKEFPVASFDEAAPGYLFGSLYTVQKEQRIYYARFSGSAETPLEWKLFCERSDNLVQGFLAHGDHVYAVTHEGAPRYKLIRTSLSKPDWKNAETVLPEAADSIVGIDRNKDYLFVTYSDGIRSRVLQLELSTGKKEEVKLPATGTVGLACPDLHSNRCLIILTSWTLPATRYEYDAKAGTFEKSLFNSDVTYPGFDELVSEEVEVPSHDGTLVPLSIIYRKGLKLDGNNSCLLEGYGAYGMSMTPYFDIHHSVALRGVVVAYAHIRGGGEKGEAWHRAGYKTTKPNTWKDFIACAEYLVKKGYTSPSKLAGSGTSAGGILITRAITERPDLFAAAVCNVGCANALRLEFSANGPVNIPEFGTVTIEEEFKALFAMDGVQHVREGVSYPAVLGVAGWNDPRVPAWQPGKFVAAVQHANPKGRPMLLKVNYDNGHFTEDKQVAFRNFAAQFAFQLWQTGHPDFQPSP